MSSILSVLDNQLTKGLQRECSDLRACSRLPSEYTQTRARSAQCWHVGSPEHFVLRLLHESHACVIRFLSTRPDPVAVDRPPALFVDRGMATLAATCFSSERSVECPLNNVLTSRSEFSWSLRLFEDILRLAYQKSGNDECEVYTLVAKLRVPLTSSTKVVQFSSTDLCSTLFWSNVAKTVTRILECYGIDIRANFLAFEVTAAVSR